MKVVLNEDVEHLGYRGDIVTVAAGYARNYLLPKKLALPATPGNLDMISQKRRAWAALEERSSRQAQELADRIAALTLRVEKKAGETETLYGSVTTAEIAEMLAAKGIEIDRRKIRLKDPIKTLGSFTVPVKLHREVVGEIKLEVKPEAAPEQEAAPPAAPEPTDSPERTDEEDD